jgi:hypothetical protein
VGLLTGRVRVADRAAYPRYDAMRTVTLQEPAFVVTIFFDTSEHAPEAVQVCRPFELVANTEAVG